MDGPTLFPFSQLVNLFIVFSPVEPARFVTKLQNLTIPMTQNLRLHCTFIGAPKLFVTWYKDGKQLYASYRYNTKVTKNSCTLECLHECNEETSGRYSCEVSNSYGTDVCHAQITAVTGGFAKEVLPSIWN